MEQLSHFGLQLHKIYFVTSKTWETMSADFIWALYFLTAIQRGQGVFTKISLGNQTAGIKTRAFFLLRPAFMSPTELHITLCQQGNGNNRRKRNWESYPLHLLGDRAGVLKVGEVSTKRNKHHGNSGNDGQHTKQKWKKFWNEKSWQTGPWCWFYY